MCCLSHALLSHTVLQGSPGLGCSFAQGSKSKSAAVMLGLPLSSLVPHGAMQCCWVNRGSGWLQVFVNVATGGFGTEVTVKTDENLKQQLGGAAYVITGNAMPASHHSCISPLPILPACPVPNSHCIHSAARSHLHGG